MSDVAASGFSPSWLALREHADARARNGDLARDMALRLARVPTGKEGLRVVDLGAGTGANLRATAPLLHMDQHWYLLDHAPDLTDAARATLSAWADTAAPTADGLDLVKDGQRITVSLVLTDLSRSLAAISAAAPHLVTASAFFDLVSGRFADALAAECARLRAAFFTVLTCDGRDAWTPAHGDDDTVAAAFLADQGRDKGFGPALGNAATHRLETAFRANLYHVRCADSPWRLDPADAQDAALIRALANGTAAAAAAGGRMAPDHARAWGAARSSAACEIGHRDLLAVPDAWDTP
ncbi:SAM-dependent methyltransferase [Aquabacter cavernae]|uniref:SAM-dependent methyltransferase n=1 Tax=Aquabacter cavernae TaxID=2496029 RepID=UPI000F8CBB01|nr:SAM-dependent methyltransferase [Aquabacter cavernae]